MLNLAQEQIVERFKRPLFAGRLENPDFSLDGANPFCGDEVHLEVRLDGGKVRELRHQVRACAVCTASTDLLAEYLPGKMLSEVKTEDVTDLLGIPLSPTRLKCALLPLETLKEGIKRGSD